MLQNGCQKKIVFKQTENHGSQKGKSVDIKNGRKQTVHIVVTKSTKVSAKQTSRVSTVSGVQSAVDQPVPETRKHCLLLAAM